MRASKKMKNNDYIDQAYEAAHHDYMKRKDEIISKLQTIKNTKEIKKLPNKWIDQTIEFIKEKEI